MKRNTENKLFDALDRIVSGKAKYTSGALTQNNLCTEAGVSRTTLNRYKNVLEEFNRAKCSNTEVEAIEHPVTIQDKNKELMDANSLLRKKNQTIKEHYERELSKSRQQIFILTRKLEALEKRINIRGIK